VREKICDADHVNICVAGKSRDEARVPDCNLLIQFGQVVWIEETEEIDPGFGVDRVETRDDRRHTVERRGHVESCPDGRKNSRDRIAVKVVAANPEIRYDRVELLCEIARDPAAGLVAGTVRNRVADDHDLPPGVNACMCLRF
jgi:hypothetical protein